MKIKNDFVLSQMDESYIVVPVGDECLNFNAVISLNDTGAFLWKQLQNDISCDKLVKLLTDEYEVDITTAQKDVDAFVEKLKGADLLEA